VKSFELNGKSVDIQAPSVLQKFVVTADIHCNSEYVQKTGSDFQLHVIAGDLTNHGWELDYIKVFKKMHTRPIIAAIGNHDTRSNNY
jgi:predicted phosphodiesterase